SDRPGYRLVAAQAGMPPELRRSRAIQLNDGDIALPTRGTSRVDEFCLAESHRFHDQLRDAGDGRASLSRDVERIHISVRSFVQSEDAVHTVLNPAVGLGLAAIPINGEGVRLSMQPLNEIANHA